ncbi:hypothetical protein GWI33_003702, partial [Rhynchophorus ferrugineus]
MQVKNKVFHLRYSILVVVGLQFIEAAISEATPEDGVTSNSINFNLNAEDNSFTSAFLNVTFKTDHGWKWDKTEVGRYGGGFV